MVDTGYLISVGYIGLYKCKCYHLLDFRHSSKLKNANEVFNYYHSSLRCTIERTFGVWKNRFAILRRMPKFKIETQVQIVSATMAIHNFIRRNTSTDTEFNHYEDEDILEGNCDDHVVSDPFPSLNIVSSSEMDNVRDAIRNQIVAHTQDY